MKYTKFKWYDTYSNTWTYVQRKRDTDVHFLYQTQQDVEEQKFTFILDFFIKGTANDFFDALFYFYIFPKVRFNIIT